MTTLTLIDPQPIDTLPGKGGVFIEVTNTIINERYVRIGRAERTKMGSQYRILHAWSDTAKFVEGE